MAIQQSHGGADVNTVAEKTGFSYVAVQRAINGRPDRQTKGLLEKVPGLRREEVRETYDGSVTKPSIRYSLKNLNAWELYNSEFITLKDE